MLTKVQSHYRKVTQETPKNPEIFVLSYLQLSFGQFQQSYYSTRRKELYNAITTNLIIFNSMFRD